KTKVTFNYMKYKKHLYLYIIACRGGQRASGLRPRVELDYECRSNNRHAGEGDACLCDVGFDGSPFGGRRSALRYGPPHYLRQRRSSRLLMNVNMWSPREPTHQMDRLRAMLAQQPVIEAAGVTFEIITSRDALDDHA